MRALLGAPLPALSFLGLVPEAVAQTNTIPPGSPLIPTGLTAGDEFRLLFVTSTTRNAASTDVADYSSFVQTRAAAGHTGIRAFSGQLRVVGSTAATSAKTNTSTTGTGVPICRACARSPSRAELRKSGQGIGRGRGGQVRP